jgi:hypothetical protein
MCVRNSLTALPTGQAGGKQGWNNAQDLMFNFRINLFFIKNKLA